MKINKIFNEQLSIPKNVVLKFKQTCILFLFFLFQSCTSGVEVAANLHKMRKFFRENPRFEKYNTEQRDLVSIQQRNSQLTPWKFA